MPGNAVVTHTDLDGVASAAIYARLAGLEPDSELAIYMTEPYKLHRTLGELVGSGVRRVAIMDLGPNADTFEQILSNIRKLVASGVKVEWYDHHRWSEDWIHRLQEAGVAIYVDVSTCAAGVVARYAPRELGSGGDEFVERLVKATCAADLWRWDDPLAPRLYRVVDRYRGPRGDKWKRSIIAGFYRGELWWNELNDALNSYLEKEFKGFNAALRNSFVREFNGCRVVFALKNPGPPNASILGNSLLYRFHADIAVIVRKKGKGISLRSTRVNVREIAYAMGGGGHPRAAGAPLRLPLLYRIVAIVYPKIRLVYAAKLIREALEKLGGCPRGD